MGGFAYVYLLPPKSSFLHCAKLRGGVNLVRHIEVNPNFLGTEYESIFLKTTLKLYVRLRRNRVSFFDRVTGGRFLRGCKDEHMNIVIFQTEICCGKSCRRARGVGGGIKMSHFPRKYHSFLSHHLNSSCVSVQVMWVLSSCAAKSPTALHFALCFRPRRNCFSISSVLLCSSHQ